MASLIYLAAYLQNKLNISIVGYKVVTRARCKRYYVYPGNMITSAVARYLNINKPLKNADLEAVSLVIYHQFILFNMSFKCHQESLTNICKICTNRIHHGLQNISRKRVYCKSIKKEIWNVFGVSTWKYITDQHPSQICKKCSRTIRHKNL